MATLTGVSGNVNWAISEPDSVSHSRTVRSALPDAIIWASLEMSRAYTSLRWPEYVLLTVADAMSQTCRRLRSANAATAFYLGTP
jgi:hypothetical protein